MSEFVFAELPTRAKASYIAHAFKAAFKQHHQWLTPTFRRFFGADAVVFDVGGHSGQFAKLFAAIASAGTVYSFEPGSYPRSLLRLAARLRNIPNISFVAHGLGDADRTTTLVTPLKPSGTFRYGLAHMVGGGEEGVGGGDFHREDCRMTTIDRFAAEAGLTRLDFIKLDVEGWEARVLRGGARTIKRFKPAMMIELVGDQLARSGDDLDSVWSELLSWGYFPVVNHGGAEKVLRPALAPRDGDTFWLPRGVFEAAGVAPGTEFPIA